MDKDFTYSLERYTAEVEAKAYIDGSCNAEYFLTLCRQCRNYGRRYGCPPFDEDPLLAISIYNKVRVIGVKITPKDKALPLEAADDLMKPVITELNKELLEAEKSLNGMSFGFAGCCPYCNGDKCARIDGSPCRHPDKVRPSLEAIGFDISKTAKDLLGIDIKWSQNGMIPEYLTLVCGIFY